MFIAIEDNLTYLHFGFLVDFDIENHLILASYVVTLNNINLGILVSLIVEILLGQNLSTVNHVGRNLCTTHNAQLTFHIVTFRLLQTIVVDSADTRTGSQMYAEIDFLVDNRVGCDGNLRKQTMLPITLNGFSNFSAWHVNNLSDAQSRQSCQYIVLIAFNSFHGQSANLQMARRACIRDVGVDNLVLRKGSDK